MAFDAALAREIGLNSDETALFRKLSTPDKIQDFLTGIPINFEPQGDTCQSARMALRNNSCHCIEAAFIAAAALMLHLQPALLMDFQAAGEMTIAALFRDGNHWVPFPEQFHWLRWRDPVYASPRELAMSYFHEYVNVKHKTLRRVSKPFDIGKYDPDYWLTSEENCWSMAEEIDASPHEDLISTAQARKLKLRDSHEVRADTFKEFTR